MEEWIGLKPGDAHYRAFVGRPEWYDLLAALQFNVLTSLGLREHHKLLDIGCGSLRAGRLFIPYLLAGGYCGVEPEQWLVEDAIKREVTQALIDLKGATFRFTREYDFADLGPFDYVLAQSIFTHAPLRDIERCLAAVKRVINSDGLFVVTYSPGETDHSGNDWTYPGIVNYKSETISSLIEAAGFKSRELAFPHPAKCSWLLITE